jgi:hypothetical protein
MGILTLFPRITVDPKMGLMKVRHKENVTYVQIEPGNGTRYELVLTDVKRLGLTGCGPVESDNHYVLVSKFDGASLWSFPFHVGHLITPGYMHEKTQMGIVDCEALAPILTEILKEEKWA